MGNEPDKINLMTQYRKFRNKLNKLTAMTQTTFYKTKIEQHKNYSNNLWKSIKKIGTGAKPMEIKQMKTSDCTFFSDEQNIDYRSYKIMFLYKYSRQTIKFLHVWLSKKKNYKQHDHHASNCFLKLKTLLKK